MNLLKMPRSSIHVPLTRPSSTRLCPHQLLIKGMLSRQIMMVHTVKQGLTRVEFRGKCIQMGPGTLWALVMEYSEPNKALKRAVAWSTLEQYELHTAKSIRVHSIYTRYAHSYRKPHPPRTNYSGFHTKTFPCAWQSGHHAHFRREERRASGRPSRPAASTKSRSVCGEGLRRRILLADRVKMCPSRHFHRARAELRAPVPR